MAFELGLKLGSRTGGSIRGLVWRSGQRQNRRLGQNEAGPKWGRAKMEPGQNGAGPKWGQAETEGWDGMHGPGPDIQV